MKISVNGFRSEVFLRRARSPETLSAVSWENPTAENKRRDRKKIIFFKKAALLSNLHKFVETAYNKCGYSAAVKVLFIFATNGD